MENNDGPAVTWSLSRRVRYFGGIGLMCAAIVIILELLVADVRGGQAFNQHTRTGSMPLWPYLRAMAVWGLVSGLAIGVLLPLYKRRHGGIVIGLAVYALLIVSLVVAGRSSRTTATNMQPWQIAAGVVLTGMAAATLGSEGRSLALGEESEPSHSPPVA